MWLISILQPFCFDSLQATTSLMPWRMRCLAKQEWGIPKAWTILSCNVVRIPTQFPPKPIIILNQLIIFYTNMSEELLMQWYKNSRLNTKMRLKLLRMQPVGSAVTHSLLLILLYFISSFSSSWAQTKYLWLQVSESGGSGMLLIILSVYCMFLSN